MAKNPALPRIAAHFALTADGKISTRNLTPSQFTSPADKARLREIRAKHDAILAGRGTVAADTMSMRLSDPRLRAGRVRRGLPAEPLRVVVSNAGRLDPSWKIFRGGGAPVVVFSTIRMPAKTRSALAGLCDLHLFESETVSLPAALAILRSGYGVKSLVCEGGGELLRSLAAEGLLDEIHLTVAPVVFGGLTAPTLTGLPDAFLPEPLDFRIAAMRAIGGECVLHLKRSSKKKRTRV
jgi:riboflavin-specific deaminase-like protein